ncbi:helix-turn-helix domain-containing protein [Pseudoalteromonas xiamenensis]|uniref:helix-turn-helix domain-containing protein n=1 Tax=Pseudoalteromonas xiamenensis TaxID=882626 RepID=UPI00355B5367
MNHSNQTICIDGISYGVDQLVDCKVIARLVGLSHRTIEDMASRRELPMYKVGRSNRYCIADILTWLSEKQN